MLSTQIIRAVHRFKYQAAARSISEDVEYALRTASTYLAIAERFGLDLSHASILELGPGLSFAAQLALAGYGARVAVADRFLAPWHAGYHPHFYREFRARWVGPTAALDQVIAAGRYPPDVIACINRPAEQLSQWRGQKFDLIVSNAVLEHVFDLACVARNLADLTRPRGVNSHQIDFGDHLDRSRPLEFLTRSDTRFYLEKLRHPSQGNRLRQSECVAIFKGAGFDVDMLEPNAFAEDGYMQEFLLRLRRSKSRYRDWAAADLRVLGTRLSLRRP